MAIVNIREKCITIARNEVRRNCNAKRGGRSVFIKRCYGTYRLMAMDVTAKQRACRALFADAQRLAAEDMKRWNRRRYWKRLARAHKVKCGHRMAVSWYYRMLKESGGDVSAERVAMRVVTELYGGGYKRYFDTFRAMGEWVVKSQRRAVFGVGEEGGHTSLRRVRVQKECRSCKIFSRG